MESTLITNYQEFILEALKSTETKPTKHQMQFAYVVLHLFTNNERLKLMNRKGRKVFL